MTRSKMEQLLRTLREKYSALTYELKQLKYGDDYVVLWNQRARIVIQIDDLKRKLKRKYAKNV